MPRNISVISGLHHFMDVLSFCDALIRATTTDGDSLSIREALFLGKPVVTTDCVTRPSGCTLYKAGQTADLERSIVKLAEERPLVGRHDAINGYTDVRDYYAKYTHSFE
jgi:hypothetical protein